MVLRRVGKYEVGRTIGEGNFAKVKFAQNTETGESVAMKVLDRSTIIRHKMVDQVSPPSSPSSSISLTETECCLGEVDRMPFDESLLTLDSLGP